MFKRSIENIGRTFKNLDWAPGYWLQISITKVWQDSGRIVLCEQWKKQFSCVGFLRLWSQETGGNQRAKENVGQSKFPSAKNRPCTWWQEYRRQGQQQQGRFCQLLSPGNWGALATVSPRHFPRWYLPSIFPTRSSCLLPLPAVVPYSKSHQTLPCLHSTFLRTILFSRAREKKEEIILFSILLHP